MYVWSCTKQTLLRLEVGKVVRVKEKREMFWENWSVLVVRGCFGRGKDSQSSEWASH